MTIPLSVVDIAPVGTGVSPSSVVRDTVELARLAERLGYVRYWFAEHHGMPSIASSGRRFSSRTSRRSPSASASAPAESRCRNHSPLAIAEAFHTLEARPRSYALLAEAVAGH